MKINNIILYNFGSYEGEAIFDTKEKGSKNIVLVGGKNGAGKTTLFTAMRLCLYGYMSMGYKNMNSFYTRAILKLVNNHAKMTKPTHSYVTMQIALSNGRELDYYTLKRSWVISEIVTETFEIIKNDIELDQNDISDFEKYILSMIPPELFNLYFFDGEKIADFFMNEGSNTRIKEAFLTLCGYDTFDIMRKNFKRIGTGATNSSPVLDEYVKAKDEAETTQKSYDIALDELKDCLNGIDTCQANILALEKNYLKKGGITQSEWNTKIFAIKEEEKTREGLNTLLRQWANERVPFLMIRNQIVAVKQQIEKETSNLKYRNFCEILNTDDVKKVISKYQAKVEEAAYLKYGSNVPQILDLSFEQSSALLAQINTILAFKIDEVAKCKRMIKSSIVNSAKIRKELENSSVTTVQEYMGKRAELFENKSNLLNKQIEIEQKIVQYKGNLEKAVVTLNKVQIHLENEIKRASIDDISAKAIIMLDKLQNILYQQQILKSEEIFRKAIPTLMRKTHFIDDIKIDNDFNIHIYRNEHIKIVRLLEVLKTNSEEQILALLGGDAFNKMKKMSGASTLKEIATFYKKVVSESIELPVEIDKTTLSNGEKQIFIMALYYSLVQLCSHEIPFIIDTPFARIDTEHRQNISKYFFSKLRGQVFILSTNEEINSTHIQILKNKIAATYMLENTDNKRTAVIRDSYFEV